jgi:hypothetical protein
LTTVIVLLLVTAAPACYDAHHSTGDGEDLPDWTDIGTDDVDSADGDRDGGPACSPNLAGKLQTNGSGYFFWYEYFGDHPVGPGEVVIVRFAIIPFDRLTDVSLRSTANSLEFEFGQVDGVLPYTVGAWNVVSWELDLTAWTCDLEVNGSWRRGMPMTTHPEAGPVFNAFAIATGNPLNPNPEGTAWVDGISVSIRSESGETVVFSKDFQDGEPPAAVALAEGCTVDVLPPPLPLDDPIACDTP